MDSPPHSLTPGLNHVLRLRFPCLQHVVLPVAGLDLAVGFYAPVFGLQLIDQRRTPRHVVLRRDQLSLALYEVPGYVRPDIGLPTLVFSADPAEFEAVRNSVRLYGGAILDDGNPNDPAPTLRFTDPHASNLLECRPLAHPSAIHPA